MLSVIIIKKDRMIGIIKKSKQIKIEKIDDKLEKTMSDFNRQRKATKNDLKRIEIQKADKWEGEIKIGYKIYNLFCIKYQEIWFGEKNMFLLL